MIQSCPTCPIRFNDETVAACPKCKPVSRKSEHHAQMSMSCASCGLPFKNTQKWWEQHGNYCNECVAVKLNVLQAKENAPERRIARGKYEQMFVELYDKFPTTLELEQFMAGMVARQKVRAMEKGGEE